MGLLAQLIDDSTPDGARLRAAVELLHAADPPESRALPPADRSKRPRLRAWPAAGLHRAAGRRSASREPRERACEEQKQDGRGRR